MTLVVRLLTLLTIAGAGFAMPMMCAQGGAVAAATPVAIESPAAQQLETPPADISHLNEAQEAVAALAGRVHDQAPFDCGKTRPVVTDHSAVFDTLPFVPGYLGATLPLDEDQPGSFAAPPWLIPIESRAGPPDAPPPKSID
jgi:hypothetical protein